MVARVENAVVRELTGGTRDERDVTDSEALVYVRLRAQLVLRGKDASAIWPVQQLDPKLLGTVVDQSRPLHSRGVDLEDAGAAAAVAAVEGDGAGAGQGEQPGGRQHEHKERQPDALSHRV